MNRRGTLCRSRAGVALLTALSLLLLFSFLGTVYVRYMEIENERTDFELRLVRARHTSAAGVYAAVTEVQAALEAGRAPADRFEFELPVYRVDRRATLGFAPHDSRRAVARVTVTDESGKINLNHAPGPVLQAILGVDEAGAAKIVESLPRKGNPDADWIAGGDRTWLISLDDMVARGLLDQTMAKAVDTRLVTFFTVADHAQPSAYLNVNAAPPQVIAAALGVSLDTARAVVAARPFSTLAEVSAAAAKDLAGFHLPPDAFSFASHCFRIVSEGRYSNVYSGGREYRTSRRRVEAVVIFDAAGAPSVRMWSEAARWDDTAENETET